MLDVCVRSQFHSSVLLGKGGYMNHGAHLKVQTRSDPNGGGSP